ncbi:MAG: hypothetical protein ACK55I_14030, partial [bacterium]
MAAALGKRATQLSLIGSHTLLLSVHLGEEHGHVEGEQFRMRQQLPGELLSEHFRAVPITQPALDHPRFHIDDPVLDALSLVPFPLH